MTGFIGLLRRFRSDEKGAFIALFGVIAVVLIAISGAVVDYTSVEQARTRAQVALDAAALGLQPKIYDPNFDIKSAAQALLTERVADSRITSTVTGAVRDLEAGTLTLNARLVVPLAFVQLVGIETMRVRLRAQATRGSMDIEVAVALDTTGSMSGRKISDLIAATNELIETVVQDVQEPTYTKMALVPYSMAVNVGSYADRIRGPVTRPGITGAAYLSAYSTTIRSISKRDPIRITTTANHGLDTGAFIRVDGVNGSNSFKSLNGNFYRVTRISNTRFSLQQCASDGSRCSDVDSSRWSGSYAANSGSYQSCLTDDCEVVLTGEGHPFASGDYAFISGIGGMTQINSQTFTVGTTTNDTFVLAGTNGRQTDYGTYRGGGVADCYEPGCLYYRFQSASRNQWTTHAISTCVTERVGRDAYNDAPPSTTPVGRNYPSASNPCLSNQIRPLTSDKAALHRLASNLVAEGSTAGQTGLAWAWYLVSPEFGYLWPSDSRPAAYGTKNLTKVVVLMTDGQFNSVYCDGVISANSTSGSGSVSDHINCNAQNGSSYSQGASLCTEMKKGGDGVAGTADDIIVYTVGFDIEDQPEARSIMANCATDAGYAFLANTGLELSDAFAEIGRKISSLRISL